MACKALFSINCSFTMELCAIVAEGLLITTATSTRRKQRTRSAIDPDLFLPIWDYVRTHALRYGHERTAKDLGVSRQTLWRLLKRFQMGRAIPRAVVRSVGDTAEALEVARLLLTYETPRGRFEDALRPLPKALEDTLIDLSATPLTTVRELSRLVRVPASTLRDRLQKLTDRGLVDSLPHQVRALGLRPRRRYFPTEKGIIAGGAATRGQDYFLGLYPVSRQWFRLLAERLDAIAVLYHVAAMIAEVDPHKKPVRVDLYRQGPYDMLITLSGGRSVGIMRQGPTLPSSNLRFRIRTMEQLAYDKKPSVTLILTYSDQASRRAIRTLSDPWVHPTTFVATEGEQLAGGARSPVWQRCGAGRFVDPPVKVDPDGTLRPSSAWTDHLVKASLSDRSKKHVPNPDALYSSNVRIDVPEPTQQLKASLAIQLTGAEKEALDLLAAWPLSTRKQLAGLMGGVTTHRAGQVLRSLTQRSLVRSDGALHTLTDEGLTYLARRDRAAVGPLLDRWTAETGYQPATLGDHKAPIYPGSTLRIMISQLEHHTGITNFAAALRAEAARSPDYDVFDLLPTSRSTIGYWYSWTNYVLHPDASFTLDYKGKWTPCLLEFERRATTPKRIPARLESYRRYFRSGWPDRDHGGKLPLVLFVFETPTDEDMFLTVASTVERVPLFTSNVQTLIEKGVLGHSWRMPPPHPPDRWPLKSLTITELQKYQ